MKVSSTSARIGQGQEFAGVFSNSDDLANQLLAVGDTSAEKVWLMPLAPAFDRMIDSPHADMQNLGGKGAGASTAAQFLQRFVGDVPWAHLDIAGVAWKDKSDDSRQPAWAKGYGARLLKRWIADNYES